MLCFASGHKVLYGFAQDSLTYKKRTTATAMHIDQSWGQRVRQTRLLGHKRQSVGGATDRGGPAAVLSPRVYQSICLATAESGGSVY